jgi:tight adherence protein C
VNRLLVLAGVFLWIGLTLIFSGIRRFTRPSLSERLRPYHPGAPAPVRAFDPTAPLRQLVGPLLSHAGGRLAALFGVAEDAATRLQRVHSPLTVTALRARELAWAGCAFMVATTASVVLRLPAPLAILMVIGAPLFAFLLIEQRLSTASAHWQRDVLYELPVVSEQVAMLLAAGYSLGAALNRVSQRSQGCCARDLADVANRVRQGVAGPDALREWSKAVKVPAVDRLVAVLAVNGEASDLGRLVAVEARQCRREVHRRTMEIIERRSEQVWVPVTVATLVPGVILIAVPFLSALHAFSGS